MSAASPEYQRGKHQRVVPWSSSFVIEVQRSVHASYVMLFFTIFYLCFGQILNNVISQAGQMETGGLSNDTFEVLNPIACIILGPLILKWLYPLLSRHGIRFGPLSRMTAAFVFMGAGMTWTTITQHLIYSAGPCYDHPLQCPAALYPGADGKLQRHPNDISVWIQIPTQFILGAAEILGICSLSEYAYAQAPANMKAFLQALIYATGALGSGLGMALGPVSKDPNLVVMYATLAGVTSLCGAVFWFVFRGRDEREERERLASMSSDVFNSINSGDEG